MQHTGQVEQKPAATSRDNDMRAGRDDPRWATEDLLAAGVTALLMVLIGFLYGITRWAGPPIAVGGVLLPLWWLWQIRKK